MCHSSSITQLIYIKSDMRPTYNLFGIKVPIVPLLVGICLHNVQKVHVFSGQKVHDLSLDVLPVRK